MKMDSPRSLCGSLPPLRFRQKNLLSLLHILSLLSKNPSSGLRKTISPLVKIHSLSKITQSLSKITQSLSKNCVQFIYSSEVNKY